MFSEKLFLYSGGVFIFISFVIIKKGEIVSTTLYFDDYKTCVCFTNFSTKCFSLKVYTKALLKENRSAEALTEAPEYLQKHRSTYRSTGVPTEAPELIQKYRSKSYIRNTGVMKQKF